MVKEVFKAPLMQIIATNPIIINNKSGVIVEYDRKITNIGEIYLYRNLFNVLLTLNDKNPIFLDSEVDDMIQNFFLLSNSDTHSFEYADTTNMVSVGNMKIPKRRILKRK